MNYSQMLQYRNDICPQRLYERCEGCDRSWKCIDECEVKQ